MSTLQLNALQIGKSNNAIYNFTFRVPAVQDGSFYLSRGNFSSPLEDLLKFKANGQIVFARPYLENRVAMAANVIDLAAGSVFTKSISANTTFSLTNLPASGEVCIFILDIYNGGSFLVSWWGGVKWAGGTAPILTVSGRDKIAFITYDGGTTWDGFLLGKDMK